jgi:hypothetical protein
LNLSQPLLYRLFFIIFLTQFTVIVCPLVMLPYPRIDDFVDCGTLLSPELEALNLPESTEGGHDDTNGSTMRVE